MNDDLDIQATLADLKMQVIVTKTLCIGILSALVDHDPELARKIISTMPQPSPPGTTPLHEEMEILKVLLDDLLNPLRGPLGMD